MKVFRCTLILLFCSSLLAQNPSTKNSPSSQNKASSTTPQAKAHKMSSAAVPADASVITVPGICSPPAAKSEDCKTQVTRAQFESLVKALSETWQGRGV